MRMRNSSRCRSSTSMSRSMRARSASLRCLAAAAHRPKRSCVSGGAAQRVQQPCAPAKLLTRLDPAEAQQPSAEVPARTANHGKARHQPVHPQRPADAQHPRVLDESRAPRGKTKPMPLLPQQGANPHLSKSEADPALLASSSVSTPRKPCARRALLRRRGWQVRSPRPGGGRTARRCSACLRPPAHLHEPPADPVFQRAHPRQHPLALRLHQHAEQRREDAVEPQHLQLDVRPRFSCVADLRREVGRRVGPARRQAPPCLDSTSAPCLATRHSLCPCSVCSAPSPAPPGTATLRVPRSRSRCGRSAADSLRMAEQGDGGRTRRWPQVKAIHAGPDAWALLPQVPVGARRKQVCQRQEAAAHLALSHENPRALVRRPCCLMPDRPLAPCCCRSCWWRLALLPPRPAP